MDIYNYNYNYSDRVKLLLSLQNCTVLVVSQDTQSLLENIDIFPSHWGILAFSNFDEVRGGLSPLKSFPGKNHQGLQICLMLEIHIDN